MTDPNDCACDKCARERFTAKRYGLVLDLATPVYNAIAGLVQASYQLADELFSTMQERDQLAQELAVIKEFNALAQSDEAKP